MPGNTRPVADERDGLLSYLAQQRYVLRLAAHGLTDEQAAATPTVSKLCVGGLIKHAAAVERSWMDIVLERSAENPDGRAENYDSGFRLGPDETLASVLRSYQSAARDTDATIAAIPDLGQPVPVPSGVPWFPKDVTAWSVRWVLLHLITETARHAGHADIIRESLDGASAFPLMAAVEGWPANPWLKSWEAPSQPAR